MKLPDTDGMVLFCGGKDPFQAGPGAVLTDLIDVITHSDFSHTAMKVGANIYESTRHNGVSGPQMNDLAGTCQAYKNEGGKAYLYPFLPQFVPDWPALIAQAEHMIELRKKGLLPYNVKRLFGDAVEMSWVFDMVTLPADGIITKMAADSKGVVCSEMAGLLIQAGGVVPKLTAAGIPWLPTVHPAGQPIGCSPQNLADMPMWQPRISLI